MSKQDSSLPRMYLAVNPKTAGRISEAHYYLGCAVKANNHFSVYNSVMPALKHLLIAVHEQDIRPEDVADYGEKAQKLIAALRGIEP